MKVERKFSEFFTEKRKWNENMETETEFCKTKTKWNFFLAETQTENRTPYPGGTNAETEFLFSANMEVNFIRLNSPFVPSCLAA
jgi:hypothetical protein